MICIGFWNEIRSQDPIGQRLNANDVLWDITINGPHATKFNGSTVFV